MSRTARTVRLYGVVRVPSSARPRIALLGLLDAAFEVASADAAATPGASAVAASSRPGPRRGEVTVAIATAIEREGRRVGTPADPGAAVTMLADLAAAVEHEVRSEVVVVERTGRRLRFAVRSRVEIPALSLRAIERHVAAGGQVETSSRPAMDTEPGRLVAAVDGCLANAAGAPLCHVYHALRRAGVAPRERPERVCQEHFAFRCHVWRAAHRQGRRLADGAEYRSWSEDVTGTVGP